MSQPKGTLFELLWTGVNGAGANRTEVPCLFLPARARPKTPKCCDTQPGGGAGVIFELVQDYESAVSLIPKDHPRRRIIGLLNEAIRRDLQFIDRRPTTLFQCLWNSCWWYDCPEAVPLANSLASVAVCAQFGPKLFRLLEHWHAVNERDTPGFPWIRSLRPPTVALGSPLVRVIGRMFFEHESFYSLEVEVSPSGAIVLARLRNYVFAFDAASGAILHRHQVPDAGFLDFRRPPGKNVVEGHDQGRVVVFDGDTGDIVERSDGNDSDRLLAVSPDGRRNVLHQAGRLCCTTPAVRIAAPLMGAELPDLRANRCHVQFTCPDGGAVFDADTGTLFRFTVTPPRIESIRTLGAPYGLRPSIACNRMAYALDAGRFCVIDLETGSSLLCVDWPARPAAAGKDGASDLAIDCTGLSIDGQYVAAGTVGGHIALWRVNDGTKVGDVDTGAFPDWSSIRVVSKSVDSIAPLPDGRRVVTGGGDGTIRLWDLTRPSTATSGTKILPLFGATAFDLVPESDLLALGRMDGSVFFIDMGAERVAHAIFCQGPIGGDAAPVAGLAFSNDGIGVGVTEKGHVALLDRMTPVRFTQACGATAVAVQGRRVAIGASDGSISVWDLGTASHHRVSVHGKEVRALALARADDLLVSVGWDGVVACFAPGGSHRVRRLCERPKPDIRDVQVSADGRRILLLGGTSIELWDSKRECMCWQSEVKSAINISFDADEKQVIVGLKYEQRILDARDGRCVGKQPARRISASTGGAYLRMPNYSEVEYCMAEGHLVVAWYPFAYNVIGGMTELPLKCRVDGRFGYWAATRGIESTVCKVEGGAYRSAVPKLLGSPGYFQALPDHATGQLFRRSWFDWIRHEQALLIVATLLWFGLVLAVTFAHWKRGLSGWLAGPVYATGFLYVAGAFVGANWVRLFRAPMALWMSLTPYWMVVGLAGPLLILTAGTLFHALDRLWVVTVLPECFATPTMAVGKSFLLLTALIALSQISIRRVPRVALIVAGILAVLPSVAGTAILAVLVPAASLVVYRLLGHLTAERRP